MSHMFPEDLLKGKNYNTLYQNGLDYVYFDALKSTLRLFLIKVSYTTDAE